MKPTSAQMTAAVFDLAAGKRAKQATARAMQKGRRKSFDKAAAFTKTRREIERHARYVGAAETDDLCRWLVAWCWFLRGAKDPVYAVTMAAYRMGHKTLTDSEAELIVEEASTAPKRMKADDLARWLGCTYRDREALRLTRIGARDVGPEARAELRKRKARLRAERRRRAKGAKPRAEYEANSLSAIKPWVAAGISRETWYRRRRKTATAGDTGSCAADSFSIATYALVSRSKRLSADVTRRVRHGTNGTGHIAAAVGTATA